MSERILITGAGGFIGNEACRWYRDKFEVVAVDNLSRKTAVKPEGVRFIHGCAENVLNQLGAQFNVVLHLAAQVSVTNSILYPAIDLQNNTSLSLYLALWARRIGVPCLIFSSTNKVYGELSGACEPIRDDHPINPQTPYGISKAAAGMYIRDTLPNASWDFRQSCICGETQRGTEDQGWIGFLRRQIAAGQPITCFGDGNQIRDLLHVHDLLRAYDLAIAGKIPPGSYTVGGGPENTVDFELAVELLGGKIDRYEPARPHDQEYFVAASDSLRGAGWKPRINARQWLAEQAVREPQLSV